MSDNSPSTQPFPSGQHEDLLELFLSQVSLQNLDMAFELPKNNGTFTSIDNFVDQELKLQTEILREQINRKVHRLANAPDSMDRSITPEKHLTFSLPYSRASNSREITLDTRSVHVVPKRSKFTNYFVLLQTRGQQDDVHMVNLALAFCTRYRNKDGVNFRLGVDAAANLARVRGGEKMYCRPLLNYSMLKTHIEAILELRSMANVLESSFLSRELLQGRLDTKRVCRIQDLDDYCQRDDSSIDCDVFNLQQQRALALEALTDEGTVLIQGPPGTGKSFCICHGIIPQVAARHEKILVVCNSNVAVDALLLKCATIESLRGRLLRCGFKKAVSSEVVEMGLYAEGISQALNQYRDTPGANSNTGDAGVQDQIRSSSIVFTTIHYASKAKDASNAEYWNFDTLVLDEAAQIEDSRLFVILARCPSLKKVILVGDPKQLQPYISDSLRRQGHGKSTMERMMDSAECTDSTAPFVMLEEQFRMAPLLREVVSRMFYDGRLTDGDCVQSRGPSKNVRLKPLLVVNVTGTKMRYSPLHQSFENEAEAAVVKEIYELLFDSAFDNVLPESIEAKDICLLTPFNRHKDRLRSQVCGVSDEDADTYSGHTFGRGAASPLKKSQALLGTQDSVDSIVEAQLENIDTVDKFQGSERKVVIISTCVDTKPRRASDPHFIDVACSRAQHLLIVVGSFSHGLAMDPNWSFVRRRAEEVGSYLEHVVREDSNGEYDIDSQSLRAKLLSLVERPTKKVRKNESH